MTNQTTASLVTARQLAVKLTAASQGQSEQMIEGLMNQLLNSFGLSPEEKDDTLAKLVEFQTDLNTKMMADMLEAYTYAIAETFTDEELDGILTFMDTPAGAAYFSKQAEMFVKVMPTMTQSLQKHMPAIEAKLNEIFGIDGI